MGMAVDCVKERRTTKHRICRRSAILVGSPRRYGRAELISSDYNN